MSHRIVFFLLLAVFCPSGIADEQFPDGDIQWILDQYQVSEPVSLISAEGFTGWTKYDGKTVPSPAKWTNKEGKFALEYSDETKNSPGGELVSARQYTNFVLDFAWVASKGCNSGVKYRLKKFSRTLDNRSAISSWLGCEYQILDDFNKSEGNRGDGQWSAAALYNMFAPDKEKKRLNPHGGVNTGRIVVLDNHIEHWLNGEKVVECEVKSDAWKGALAQSKFPTLLVSPEGFGENPSGFIMLQDHGSTITFEKIVIWEIGAKK